MNILIQNATLCDHQGERKASIEIENGKIKTISSTPLTPSPSHKVFEADNLYLLPSLIDLNVKPKNYNQNELKKLEKKALSGGVGTLALTLSNDPSHYQSLSLFNLQSPTHFLHNINPYSEGKIQNISKLHKNGGKALNFPSNLSSSTLDCLYNYAKLLNIPCMCYAYDKDMSSKSSIESELSYKMGLSSMPSYLQSIEFARIAQIASFKQIPTLLHSLNDPQALSMSHAHPYLLSEVGIHHLLLNEDSILHYNTWAKLNPPLCTQDSQEQLLSLLPLIDTLSSTHQEFSSSHKEQTFEDAIGGVDCLGFYFSLLYTTLCQSKLLSLPELCKKTSFAQASLLSLNKGEITEGYDADLILVDLNESFTLNHPLYTDKLLYGKVKSLFSSKQMICEVM